MSFPRKRQETPLQAALRDARDYLEMYRDEQKKNHELRQKLDVFAAAFRVAKELASEGEHE